MKKTLFATVAFAGTVLGGAAFAEGKLNLVCSTQQDWCERMVAEFERSTGIDVNAVRKSTGETLAQVRAEASNPKIDVWWGGTGDPHLQAAELGLSAKYDSSELGNLLGWASNMHEISGGRTAGIYAGALGFGYNTEIFAEKGLTPPSCWSDLLDVSYEGEIQVANPHSSGTAYTVLATMSQLLGEDEAFKYLEALGNNISSYTKSGSAPGKNVARGEAGIAIGFQHDMIKLAGEGFPIKIVSPCEGTGYEVGSVSIIEGAKNLENAQKWVDFALSVDGQEVGAKVKNYQVPSNSGAAMPKEAPDFASIKLIDYDFATYGSTATRTKLLARWDEEVGTK